MSSNIVPPISDGQPITYEFLNQVVSAVNKLGKTESGESNQDVEFRGVGYSLNKRDSILVVVGKFSLSFDSLSDITTSTRKKTLSFNSNFKQPPLVFLSAVDESAEKQDDTSYVSLIATDISKSAFTCRARRTLSGKKAQSGDKLVVNFLAVGPAPS
jgi:hypothetical protein